MPKIIKNIEQNIFNAAFELFGEYGYTKVDMKMIAQKVGIAVGTLYNYYPNKKQLFANVLKKSWESTFYKIDSIMKKQDSAKEKIRQLIAVLYEEISGRKGLGYELIKSNVFKKADIDKFLYTKENLFEKMEKILKQIIEKDGFKLEKGMEIRLCKMTFILIAEMLAEYPDEKEKNIKFITQLVECTYGDKFIR